MAKYDAMVKSMDKKSRDNIALAEKEIRHMFKNNERITVAELRRKTGLSRAFFYNNKKVRSIMEDYQEKQEGKALVNPREQSLLKASQARIKYLEQQLANAVPKVEYENLKAEFQKFKNQKLLKAYDSI